MNKPPIGAIEHKDNFDITDSETDIIKHKATFQTTLENIQKRKIAEPSVIPKITEQKDIVTTPTTEVFRVTKEDYDRVLKDLLQVRPSRTEQEKALREQALREQKCLKAEEQALLDEKRR
jgi:hypothetical protein